MNAIRATVSKVLTYSIVDGPGNRLVIFLQGCNFDCAACHNPHTIGECTHCGDCIPACHVDALSLVNGRIAFDPLACDQCDDCLDACPIDANPMVRDYTVSGGEPTRQLGFVRALFEAIKADEALDGLDCFIDSNGNLGASGWEQLLPVTDGVMLDIKSFDNTLHREMTGKDNGKSLQSARLLHEAGKLYELRFLLVPGKTDGDAELAGLIDFVRALGGGVRVRLNAFQHHGVRPEARKWAPMSEAGVGNAAARLREAGIRNVVVPAVYL